MTDAPALVAMAATLGVTLREDAAVQLLAYLDAVLELNQHINLTAIRDRDHAVVLHALDSLAFGLANLSPQHVLDVGSGNGFPGVGVAALHHNASIVLLDRTAKKVRAIGTCLLTARWRGIETLNLDAAQAPGLHRELRHSFDTLCARALGPSATVAELAAPLLRPGGHLVLWLDADAEVPETLPSHALEQRLTYNLPEPAARQRILAVYRRR